MENFEIIVATVNHVEHANFIIDEWYRIHLFVINKKDKLMFSSVQFSHSVMSHYLRPHESQHARPPCPSPTPRFHSNSCPSSRWCHQVIPSSVIPFSSCPPSLQHQSFSNESSLCMRWPKYWSFSFSISPFSEYSGLISFRNIQDWFP